MLKNDPLDTFNVSLALGILITYPGSDVFNLKRCFIPS